MSSAESRLLGSRPCRHPVAEQLADLPGDARPKTRRSRRAHSGQRDGRADTPPTPSRPARRRPVSDRIRLLRALPGGSIQTNQSKIATRPRATGTRARLEKPIIRAPSSPAKHRPHMIRAAPFCGRRGSRTKAAPAPRGRKRRDRFADCERPYLRKGREAAKAQLCSGIATTTRPRAAAISSTSQRRGAIERTPVCWGIRRASPPWRSGAALALIARGLAEAVRLLEEHPVAARPRAGALRPRRPAAPGGPPPRGARGPGRWRRTKRTRAGPSQSPSSPPRSCGRAAPGRGGRRKRRSKPAHKPQAVVVGGR